VPRGQRDGSLRPYSWFSRQEPLLFYQVAPQLYSRGWVDPVPDPLLIFFLVVRESNPGLRICSQELWPLDHRGGPPVIKTLQLVWRDKESTCLSAVNTPPLLKSERLIWCDIISTWLHAVHECPLLKTLQTVRCHIESTCLSAIHVHPLLNTRWLVQCDKNPPCCILSTCLQRSTHGDWSNVTKFHVVVFCLRVSNAQHTVIGPMWQKSTWLSAVHVYLLLKTQY
jgi:hypothetical protein